MSSSTSTEEIDRTELEKYVKQLARGIITEEETIAKLRQAVNATQLQGVLSWLPAGLAKALQTSFVTEPGRFRSPYPPFADDLWQVVVNADRLAVLSLVWDMRQQAPETKSFHDYPVIGEVEVKDAEIRAEVIETLHRGTYGESMAKRCFMPHHGIRAVCKGRGLDLVICFICECMQVFADPKSDKHEWADIGTAPEQCLNRILAAAGVPIAERCD